MSDEARGGNCRAGFLRPESGRWELSCHLGCFSLYKEATQYCLTGRHGNSGENHEAISSGIFGVTTTPYHPTDVEWMVIQARRYERKRNPEAEEAHDLGEIEAITA
jgi:hypothetical protein